MPKKTSGHHSRSVKFSNIPKKQTRKIIKKQNKRSMSRKHRKTLMKKTKDDMDYAKKMMDQVQLESKKLQTTPALTHMNKFLTKARKSYKKGNKSEAFLYTLAASAVAASQVSLHPNVTLDQQPMSDNNLGPLLANPDVMIKWHSKHAYPLANLKVQLTRKQRRRNSRLTRKANKK